MSEQKDRQEASGNMPQNNSEHVGEPNEDDQQMDVENVDELTEDELAEIESVNSNLDSLNSALDFIEQKTDNIRNQLMDLLTSNREIHKELLEEKNRANSQNEPTQEQK